MHEPSRILNRSRILSTVSGAAGFAVTTMGLLRIFTEGIKSNSIYLLPIIGLILLSIPWVIKKYNHWLKVGILVMILVHIVLNIRLVTTGGLTSAVALWQLPLSIGITLMLGPIYGAISSVLSIGSILIVTYGNIDQYINHTYVQPKSVYAIIFTVAIIFTYSMCYFYEKLIIQAEKVLDQKNAEILLEKEQKENLVRILCHDLSNALSIVGGTAKIATENEITDPNQQKKYWERVHKAVKWQIDLIDYVRKIESLQNGKTSIELAPVDIVEILLTVKEYFHESLEDKKIKLSIDDYPLNMHFVLAEKISLFHSVLNNIISNAIKFSSPNDTIKVRLSTVNDNLILEIQDQGIGMPDEIKQNLYAKNIPTTRLGTNGEKGTGFGMVLMINYLERYNGRVEVESFDIKTHPKNHGTIFRLFFQTPSKNS